MSKYGVTHHLSTPYHPQTSGQVEVTNQGLKRILERTVGTAGDHRKLQLNELSELRDQAYENSLIYKEKTKKLHDSKIKNRIFNVGDQVLLFNSRLKIFSGKLKSRWSGPFTINEVFSYGTTKLSHPDGSNFKVNCHRLKHYYGGDTPPLVIPVRIYQKSQENSQKQASTDTRIRRVQKEAKESKPKPEKSNPQSNPGLPWMLDDQYVQVALQAPPSPDYIPGPVEPQSPPLPDFIPEPVYPEYMPQEDEVFSAVATSPTAQSPDYVPESDPEEDPEEDDDEDPKEDPVDYPADGGDDDDDEDESSEDDEDNDEVD
ncbi:reverse transcriptase domain-containing protein [Tanacetum coccineum]